MNQKKRTRIAIFTITGDMNYGNRLQNYALQEVLRSFSDAAHDVQVETVLNTLWARSLFPYYESLDKLLARPELQKTLEAHMPVQNVAHWIGREALRHQAFARFDHTYLHYSPWQIRRKNARSIGPRLREAYDWGVAGSDQLWNPYFGCASEFDFAACLPEDRRISYAGSFGVRSLPEPVRPWYHAMLSGLTHISVREAAGAAIVQQLTGRTAEVVPDPTLLLPSAIWQLVMQKPAGIDLGKPYLLVYHLQAMPAEYVAHFQAIAQARGLALVMMPWSSDAAYETGPAEFLYLVAHAAAVVTDSFHGTCFSLLFGKPFLSIILPSKNVEKDIASRIETLLAACGTEARCARHLGDLTAEALFREDLQTLPQKLRALRQQGAAFLERALSGIGGALRLHSVALMRQDACTGCTCCQAVCPQHAITMVPDGAGFLHPEVDRSACADCGLCLRACPVCTPETPEPAHRSIPASGAASSMQKIPAYAVQAKDDALRSASASGGVFALLAQRILADGGVVIGAAMGTAADGWTVRHIAIEDAADLWRLQRSKYVQSQKGDIFQKTAACLRDGRTVLFSGTGCEVRGLLSYLHAIHQDAAHLYTVDLICHGAPSPLFWQKYMQLRAVLDGRTAEGITDVHFKDKRFGWHRGGSLTVAYHDGTSYASTDDVFTKLFLHDECSRDTCYHCPARSQIIEDSASGARVWRPCDLTIGDFWGIEQTDLRFMDDDRGISLAFSYSEKGQQLLSFLEQAAIVKPVMIPEAFLRTFNPNFFADAHRPEERADVLKAIEEKDGAALLAALKEAVPHLLPRL